MISLQDAVTDLGNGISSPPMTPALIFKISRDNAIVCNALKDWEKGYCDWEEALKRAIVILEQHVKKLSEDSAVQEFIKHNAFLPIPVLEKSLMPPEDKKATPLARQQSLIKACYLLTEIQKAYLTVIARSMSVKPPL